HERHGITREPDDEKDRTAQDEERDDAVHDASDDELRHTVRLLVLHLDVFPRIGIAGGDGREDVLPFLQHHPWTDRVDERVPEHRYQIEMAGRLPDHQDRKSTRLNSSHVSISYAVFCLKKKKT